MDAMAQPDTEEEVVQPNTALEALPILLAYAEAQGDISEFLTDTQIAALTSQVIDQYDRDKQSRADWEKIASKACEDMAKTDHGTKDYPWPNASNVHYPLLPHAVMQFNARAYAAIVKGDEAVSVKVVGADKGVPMVGPDGQPMMQVQGMPVLMTPQGPLVMTPQGPQPLPEGAQPEMAWQREPGAKSKRAERVRDYMNTTIFYRMDDWEGETDQLLFQVPAVGVGFRKTWFDSEKHESRFVPAMRLVVDNDAKTLQDAPQIAEEIEGVFPHHIRRDMKVGKYREIALDPEKTEARLLLEVQCYADLDGDEIEEPYIVTLDYEEKALLRCVPDFTAENVKLMGGRLAFIERGTYYTKYEFLPHPEGKFYNIGLAHLLDQYGSVINTLLNQMLDANHAATAGGGFIASGLRIQGQGQSSSLRWRPGEYKTVSVNGQELRNGIVERTFPQLSSVALNLLEMILGAAQDIASIKDVMTGDASNQGQVGTTLALIEQGLQVFSSIYKRIYRGLKHEFSLLYDNIGRYATEETVADYMELLDDPAANFAQDFNAKDMDICPVSDPTSVTKMQQMSRAQFLLSTAETLAAVGGDVKEALRRVYEAADVEDIDKLLPKPQPNPMQEMAAQLEIAEKQAGVEEKQTKAALNAAKVQEMGANLQLDGQKINLDGWEAQARHQIDTARVQIDAFKTGAGLAQ
tara:strand:- start:10937 stop:13012 length:2076 start_codon:yes stop_codon:yes gene_type:complete